MDLSVEFAPTLTSTLRTSEINFLLDSVIVEDKTVILEDTTEDSVVIVDNTVIENIAIDDSVTIVDIVTVEDNIEDSVIIVDTVTVQDNIDDSVTIIDTVMVENVVEDKMDIDDSLNTTADSYTSDRSMTRKYMSECPIHNHHMDGTWESICPDDGPCNCM